MTSNMLESVVSGYISEQRYAHDETVTVEMYILKTLRE